MPDNTANTGHVDDLLRERADLYEQIRQLEKYRDQAYIWHNIAESFHVAIQTNIKRLPAIQARYLRAVETDFPL